MIDSQDDDSKIEKEQDIYQRVKLLGTGSFGKAYLVKQIKTDEFFVIKQINIADLDANEQENVRRQAKILQALNHPNIIKFKEVYTTSKMKLNIVMEYADGGDLATKIQQAKSNKQYFEETQILTWFTQICLGIKHIHDRKIIHRDIKGQNIFLTADNCVKIGDLGVARVLQHTIAKAKTVVGSPYYLSPQIIQNRPYSFTSDIWSLGALLYEICALVPPFTANNLQFLALKIVKGSYASIPPQYSADLKALIKSMLNTNPHTRPGINQILSTPIIHRRIKSLLTQSQNITEFSHTILHKYNPLKNQIQDKLRPPPNLMEIQQQGIINNLSAITTNSDPKKLQLQMEVKAKTPYCMGKNPLPLKKKIIPSEKKIPEQNTQDLADLMQIKATPLQHHLVPKPTPKISTPNIIKKRPQTSKPVQPVQKIVPKSKNSTASAFNKKKSIDCAQYNIKEKPKQIIKQEEQKTNYENKSCLNKQDIQNGSQKQVENISSNFIKHKTPQNLNKIKLQIKPNNLKNNGKKIQQKVNKPVIKGKTSTKNNNIKSKQKQMKQTNMQIVSQQMKQKQKSQKQKQKKIIKKAPQKKPKGQQKKVTSGRRMEQQQVVEQQKCNDASDDKYQDEEFQAYDQNLENGNQEELSFQLSHSSIQQKKQNNYQKMLHQLQLINKIVQQANGKVAELPMLGQSIPQLLQSSNQVRQDDSDLQSQLSKMTTKMLKKTEGQINLTCLTDQGELQNLRMALQQIFGIQNIIVAYQFMSDVILQQGLQFDEEQTIRNLLKACPSLDQCLLRRHFRLVATVITLQNELHQIN